MLMAVLSIGQVWADDPAAAGTTLFSEDFSSYSNTDVPNGSVTTGTGRLVYGSTNVTYTCANGAGSSAGTTKVTTDNSGNLAGGASPELMVGKKGTGTGAAGGSFSVAGIPSGGAQAITVSFKQNKQNLSVSVAGTGYTGSISGKPDAAGERTFDVTVDDGADATFTLTFQAAATSNVRVDDILVTVKTAGEGAGTPKTLTGVAVSGTPTKTVYNTGDNFDPTGLTVTGTYSDASTAPISSGITWAYTPSQTLALNQTSIGVTATVSEITSAEYNVTGLTVSDPVVSSWQVIAPADLVTGDMVVLTMLKNAVYYAAPNNGGNSAPTATAVTVVGDKLSNEPAATLQWEVTIVSAGVYQFSVGENYLKCTDTNNGVKVGTGDYNTFDVVEENEKFYLHTTETMSSAASGRYLGIYNTQDWRCYSSVNNNIKDGSLVIFKDASAAAAVVKPTISGDESFVGSTTVTITHADADHIYYTTNGVDPTTSSAEYTAPFTVDADGTTTVKAIAVKGSDVSGVASKEFTKATVLTPSEALAIINGWSSNQTSTQDYYVAGTISQIDAVNADSWATYYISADGTTTDQLQVYKGLWVNGANFSSADQIQVGDDVTIKGKLKKYNSYKELDQNNEIVLYKLKARLAWSAESFDAALEGENTFPSLTNTNDVTVSYSSSDPTKASFADASVYEITLNAAGSTTITATFAGNETYKANSASYTLNVASSLVTLTYNVDGGEPIASANVNALPNPLPTTTKAGKNFGGWFTDPEKTVDAVAGAAITENTTLYAKWLEPYTVAEALAMIDAMENNAVAENSIYVTGKVCVAPDAAPNSGRLTYFISADGDPASDQFQIYLGYGVSGANFTAQTDVQLEDAVVAYGKLKKYVKSAVVYPEFDKGSQLYSLVRKADPELAWSETSFDAYIGESNTFPTLTNDHNVAVTYSSTETDYATISNEEGHEGEITLVAVGTTTIKATFAGDEDYKAAEVSYTLNVYNPITAGTITYEENGGSEVADVETPVDNLPDPLPTPTKENNIFAGWWTTSTFEDGTQAVAGAPMNGNITLYAKWTAIPYYATVYTSNVDFVGAGSYKEAGSKVSISGTEYAAQKVGSSSNTGEVVVTVPAKTHTLHFHVFTWKNQSNVTSISGVDNIKVNGVSGTTIDVNGDDAGGGSKTYTIEGNPVDHYQYITFDAVDVPTDITFAYSSGDKRIIMYGINQEGGVLPVLDHIVITGEATELTYEIGDEFNPAGLGVNAIYTLEEVEQTPVAVDAADIEWSFDPAYIAGETTSVTVTATYGGKSANKTVTGITVNVPAPEILVDPASVAFGNVNQDDVVEAEVINVTLKSVENATIALSGDVAAFTLDKNALTANGTISVTPVTSVAGTFAATITISDDASAAESKEVALSMTVKAPEIPDVCDGTDDFATIDKTVSPTGYATRTTTDGWVGTNVRFQEIDEKMYWKINGKTTAVGTITSPVLSDGIATLKFRYANTDNESNGVSVKIEIKQSGDVVKEYTLTKANSEVTKDEVYTEIIENINVAGDFQIVITNLSPSNSTGNKDRVALGRFCWSSYSAAPEPVYEVGRGSLTAGKYYTICLPKKVTHFRGASIWDLKKRNAAETEVYLEEAQLPFAAGTPFIIQATADKLEVVYEGDATGTPVESGALRGTLTGMTYEQLDAAGTNIYILKDNAIRPIKSGNFLSANRAYIDYDELIEVSEAPVPAPGKKVRKMPMQPQTPTGLDELNAGDQPMKVMINGQFYILRGEKMYNANGQVVK